MPANSKSPKRTRGKDNIYIERQRKEFIQKKQNGRGNDLVTKVYPSDVIPDQYVERKRDYRPNNFMGQSLTSTSSSQILKNRENGTKSQLY